MAVVDGDPIVQMKPAGEMRTAENPPLVPAESHSDRPDDVDRVIGLVLGSEARAYPIGLLDRFEVVDDESAGFPFVVARCALTGVAAIYDRRVGDRVLTFENTGALWRDTLVLQDRETKSYWSAATGLALAGPLAGKRLQSIPAVVTKTEDWEKVYPGSLYLDLNRSTVVPLSMRLYEASSAQGVSGSKTGDSRYRPKQEVFVVGEEQEAVAFTAEQIRNAGSARARLAGKAIEIRWDPLLETPRAYGASSGREEIPVVPMYWFAVGRHYEKVRTFDEACD